MLQVFNFLICLHDKVFNIKCETIWFEFNEYRINPKIF
jgi:hypothetical protein